MELTLHEPSFVTDRTAMKADTIGFRVVTALFCVQTGFTAYAQLRRRVPPTPASA